jgi:CheY-like chemotaxis protein
MGKTILVVDDDPGVIQTIKYGLEGLDPDYQVFTAEGGKKCFEFLEKKKLPDIILLDVMMPDMNGWEVQKKLRERIEWKSIPIIFLTAVQDPTSKKIGDITSEGFLEKPCKLPELKQKIDKILKS